MAHLPYTISATFTAASATVTAATGAFLINVLPGDWVRGPDEKVYFVIAVASNTSLTLDRVYAGTTVTTSVKFAKHSDAWALVSDANVRLARIEEAMARGYTLTSMSSLAIGAGTKVFTGVEEGLNFLNGIRFEAVSRANSANSMRGRCAYSGSTLTMTVPAGGFTGSGTFADWDINIIGADGATGANGVNATTPGTTVVGRLPKFSNTGGTAFAQTSALAEDASGNVGIGTASPSAPLDVFKDAGSSPLLRVKNANATDARTIILFENDVSTSRSYALGIDTQGGSSKRFELRDMISGGVRLAVDTSGNLGIGTTSPSYQLHLSTDSAAKPSTNTWTISSDERLKENIVEANLERCWEIVRSVPLKRYTWKDDAYTREQVADRSKLGWIAQDVQPFFKNAVLPHVFQCQPIDDGFEEYEEQETVERVVERDVDEIEVRDGQSVLVRRVISETKSEPVFDRVAVVAEDGTAVMREIPGAVVETVNDDGETIHTQEPSTFEPVTASVPRMVKKTRPKTRIDTIDDCLSLNADQLYAAMYGALQLAMKKIEALEAEVAALKTAQHQTSRGQRDHSHHAR